MSTLNFKCETPSVYALDDLTYMEAEHYQQLSENFFEGKLNEIEKEHKGFEYMGSYYQDRSRDFFFVTAKKYHLVCYDEDDEYNYFEGYITIGIRAGYYHDGNFDYEIDFSDFEDNELPDNVKIVYEKIRQALTELDKFWENTCDKVAELVCKFSNGEGVYAEIKR